MRTFETLILIDASAKHTRTLLTKETERLHRVAVLLLHLTKHHAIRTLAQLCDLDSHNNE